MEERDQIEHIRAFLGDYLRQKGIRITKPFCCLNPMHEDKHPSMSFYAQKNKVHCFSCGVTYDIFDLIGLDYGLDSFSTQYSKAGELFGLRGTAMKPPTVRATEKNRIITQKNQEIDRNAELQELMKQATGRFDYLKSRGIREETCRKYGLFEDGERAYFPIFEGGRCIGWCGRAISAQTMPRYQNSAGSIGYWKSEQIAKVSQKDNQQEPVSGLSGFTPTTGERAGNSPEGAQGQLDDLSQALFCGVKGDSYSPLQGLGQSPLQGNAGDCCFVTEGIINALILEQMGCCAVALCGSQNAGKLLRYCAQNPTEVSGTTYILCGDDDEAGRAMNAALKDGLHTQGISCRELHLTGGDINEIYLKQPETLTAAVADALDDNDSLQASAAGSLDSFFETCVKRADAMSTGFDALDDILDGGLFSGLYVVGAISSLGKTSFVLQLADYIAAHSADVLFFSLEQSKFELIAKSLSRTSAMLDSRARKNAFTARQLLRGNPCGEAPAGYCGETLLEKTRRTYAQDAAGLYIYEGIADIGVTEIREAVRAHIARRGTQPVVVLDYLQILKPVDARTTDKQNTDRAVVELKRISRDFDIPVIAVSSFNRDNYRNAVSMEAFKESGAVEYSSDVLFGMQLAGAGEAGFDVNAAKTKEPRAVELVMLKNRNGIPYAKVNFDYYAKFNLFELAAQRVNKKQ